MHYKMHFPAFDHYVMLWQLICEQSKFYVGGQGQWMGRGVTVKDA